MTFRPTCEILSYEDNHDHRPCSDWKDGPGHGLRPWKWPSCCGREPDEGQTTPEVWQDQFLIFLFKKKNLSLLVWKTLVLEKRFQHLNKFFNFPTWQWRTAESSMNSTNLYLDMSGLYHLRGNSLQCVSSSISASKSNAEWNSGNWLHQPNQLIYRVWSWGGGGRVQLHLLKSLPLWPQQCRIFHWEIYHVQNSTV